MAERKLNRSIQSGGETVLDNGINYTVRFRNADKKVIWAEGTTLPTGCLLLAKGALFFKTDAGAGVKSVYENTALTDTAAVWNLMGSVATADIDDDAVTEAKVADSAGAGGLYVKKNALVTYDFAVDGGAQGTIVPSGSPTIPDNAVVRVVSYDVITTFTSATDAAEVALNLPVDGDLIVGVAISNAFNPWDAGAFDGSDGALANKAIKKLTGARVPQIVIAGGEDVTAGKVVFELEWWVSA